jgi:hypothetical protein
MHTDNHQSDPLVDLGYEQRDIDPKRIFKVSMYFFAFAFVSYALGWVILWGFGYWQPAEGVNDLVSNKIPKSPNPILQTNVTAKTDLINMRRAEKETLTTSGESKFIKGASRISIEQAIKLSSERGAKLNPSEMGGGK